MIAIASSGPSTSTGTALGRGVAGGSVQLGAFAVQQRVGGVEVLRPGVRVVVAVVGVAAGDEPENLGVVDDGQDEPVPEPVDDPPVPGPGDESGEFHLLMRDAELAEVVGEGGPAVGGVAGLEAWVVGDVDAESSGQVGPAPTLRRVLGAVELQRLPVHLEEAVAGDGAGVPRVAPVQHPAYVLIRGRDGAAADHREHREVCIHVPVVVDPRVGVGFGCAPVEFGQGGGGCGGGVGFVRPDGYADVQVGGCRVVDGLAVFGVLGDRVEEQRQPPHPLLTLIPTINRMRSRCRRGAGRGCCRGAGSPARRR